MPRQRCPHCNGTGQSGWVFQRPCSSCEGTGYTERFTVSLIERKTFGAPHIIEVHKVANSLPSVKVGAIEILAGGGIVECQEINLDGRLLAISTNQRPYLTLWDTATGRMCMDFRTDQLWNSLAFSPDGQFLAGGSGSNKPFSANLWRIIDGTLIRSFPDSTDHTIDSIFFSPDGSLLIIGNYYQPEIRRIRDGALVQTLEEPVGASKKDRMRVSPDGKFVFIDGRKYKIKI